MYEVNGKSYRTLKAARKASKGAPIYNSKHGTWVSTPAQVKAARKQLGYKNPASKIPIGKFIPARLNPDGTVTFKVYPKKKKVAKKRKPATRKKTAKKRTTKRKR